MKKTEPNDEMRSEYDFTGKQGERGKYSKAYRAGHTTRITEPDGTVTIQALQVAEGAVMLEPDVREVFPDSESVNAALRSLIQIMEQVSPQGKYTQKTRRRQVAEKKE